MNAPEISVIVPVYNVEKYLCRCVDSILNQTFTDFELILVDDGSPDNCGAICDDYAEKDSRVRVIHQKNRGLSCARNAGIDAARGNYLCFVDSDDLVAPDYCRVLLELVKDTEYDFSVVGVNRFQDVFEGGISDKIMSSHHKESAAVFVAENIAFLKKQFERRAEFGACNKLFRRELFQQVRFASGRLNEDVIFSADLVRICTKGVVYTDQQLYYYRQRTDGIVSNQMKRGSPDLVFAGRYLLNTVKEVCPELTDVALRYAVAYPWMFVDPIYVRGNFRENRIFLDGIQQLLRAHMVEYRTRSIFSGIQTRRMELFARSRFLYGFNAYGRLARVYLYRLLGKDAYADGHGI